MGLPFGPTRRVRQRTVFRTFAPNAASVGVIGDFNAWQEQPMSKTYDGNFWELMIPEAKEECATNTGSIRQTAGAGPLRPYGFSSELRPNTASVISAARSPTVSRTQSGCGAGAPVLTGR